MTLAGQVVCRGYLISQPGGNGHVQERKYGPTHVDFASFYNVTPNLTLTFEGINITYEVERIYGTGDAGDMDLTREYPIRVRNGSLVCAISTDIKDGRR